MATIQSAHGQCGTANYVPKSTGASTTCSLIYDNGSNVGVGAGSSLGYYYTNGGSSGVAPRLQVNTPGGDAGLLLKGGTTSSTGYWPDMGFALTNTSGVSILGASVLGVIETNSAGSESMDIAFTTKPTTDKVQERMRIQANGNVGIGTVIPAAPLDIYRPSNGAETNPIALNIHNADKSTSMGTGTAYGIKATSDNYNYNFFNIGVNGTASGSTDVNIGVQGIATASVTGTNAYAGSFNAAGSSTLNGAVGVYASAYSAATNLGISAAVTGSHPSNCAGYFTGDVLTTTGYFTTSDEKLKTNVDDFKDALLQLKKLQVKTYEYKAEEFKNNLLLPEGKNIGIMAQNVQAVFPNLVKEKIAMSLRDHETNKKLGRDVNFLAVNYVGLIPVLVSAVNELNAKTEENQQLKASLDKTNATMAAMQKQIDDMCANGCYSLRGAQSGDVSSGAENKLMQNIPNPFSTTTSIPYVLNTGVTAYMEINTLDGKLIQHTDLAVKGQGTVSLNAGGLSAGTYTYSLYVDGNAVDTKLMVIKPQN
ncbi:MAG: tail fiber domain-containing protein [Bacteroidetes bacterium]|nr:tail fiber domain-containing protein [Bacteroidota bacterium]